MKKLTSVEEDFRAIGLLVESKSSLSDKMDVDAHEGELDRMVSRLDARARRRKTKVASDTPTKLGTKTAAISYVKAQRDKLKESINRFHDQHLEAAGHLAPPPRPSARVAPGPQAGRATLRTPGSRDWMKGTKGINAKGVVSATGQGRGVKAGRQ